MFWEYKVLDASASIAAAELERELCGLGSMGWEVVGYTTVEKFGPNTVSVVLKREAGCLPAPADLAPGWQPDPQRFESRQWDGRRWTEQVMKEGMRETDFPVIR